MKKSEFVADQGLKIHILMLNNGCVVGEEDLLDRRILLQVDSCTMQGQKLIASVLDIERLKGLTAFRPDCVGAVHISENGTKRLQYYRLKSLQVQRSRPPLPSTVILHVQDLDISRTL